MQYTFLNTTRNPCVSMEDYEKCEDECIQNVYRKYFNECRFPFMSEETLLPYCKTSSDIFYKFLNLMLEYIRTNPRLHCKCARICHQVSFGAEVIAKADQNNIIVISMQRGIRAMIERHGYEFISLLCDIGGNLGLFIGLSCLSITKLVATCVLDGVSYWIQSKKHSKFSKTVDTIIEVELTKCLEAKILLDKLQIRNLSLINVIYYCTVAIAAVLSTYQTYDRVDLYFSYPVEISVDVVTDEIVQLPSIITCSLSSTIRIHKEEQAQFLNTTCGKIDLLDLLDKPSKFAGNTEELWRASDVTGDFGPKMAHIMVGDISTFSTVYGNCARATVGPIIYAGLQTILATITVKDESCDCHCKAFVITNNDQFSVKNMIYYPCDSIVNTKFTRQTVLKINLPGKRCESSENVTKCEEICYKKKLDDLITSCRLPSMTNSSKPFCTTSVAAKATQVAYFTAYLQTNPSRECGCLNKCNETIYIPKTYHFDFSGFTCATYSLPSNVREVISQYLAFPLVKLYCDIGSNVGFLLGLSILSFAELIQTIISKASLMF